MMPTDAKITPMMEQWHACKKTAANAVLLFRMGDFYEAFYDDAALLAKELDLTLTSRQNIPMSGIPYHTCSSYVDKLVSKGHRVAIAEQTSNPKASKGLVKREVVRVVTPGTLIDSSLLSAKSNNFFAAVTRVGAIFGMASIDLSTASFGVCEFEKEHELLNEISRLQPSEFLTSQKFADKHRHLFDAVSYDFLLNTEEDWRFDHQITYDFLASHFGVQHLDGFGLKGKVASINAAGALLYYLQETLSLPIDHIQEIHSYSTSHFMTLDYTTQRNLELTRSQEDGSRKHTLLAVVDDTQTPMGGRLMQQWVKQPLLNVAKISARHDAVEAFLKKPEIIDTLQTLFEEVRDIERLMMKISANYATPRDLVALRFSMEPIARIQVALQDIASSLIYQEADRLDSLPAMTHAIAHALVDDPPVRLSEGQLFRDGFHQELDAYRNMSRNSKSWLAKYQATLKEETGIKTLRVGFNKMFGYYIEVSKGQTQNVPDTFQRRQTLTNAERYITPELKDYEQKVLIAEEKVHAIEAELFHALREEIAAYSQEVLRIAKAVAQIDCLLAFANAARQHDYVRPIIDDSQKLHIIGGRHPVIETAAIGEKFVPNDALLDDEHNRLLLITGPNMAGKSTYMRQVALITILAQIGAFVPAKSAHIGVVDKVFTRIGASDDLSRGRSTFMVEMTETANILHNATSRSLVILDEIGRGTSTYDGISIAWSVAEFLLTTEGKKAKTLFATHYWELTQLEASIPGAVNYHIAVHESDGHIVFLRKIVKGGTDKSYGIHVARLAGIPFTVIERAQEMQLHLERNASRKKTFTAPSPPKRKRTTDAFQLTLFGD